METYHIPLCSNNDTTDLWTHHWEFFVSTPVIHVASDEDQWNPPSNLVVPLDQAWKRDERTCPNLYTHMNSAWDQIMANKGCINYCVRWNSSAPVSTSGCFGTFGAISRTVMGAVRRYHQETTIGHS